MHSDNKKVYKGWPKRVTKETQLVNVTIRANEEQNKKFDLAYQKIKKDRSKQVEIETLKLEETIPDDHLYDFPDSVVLFGV